MFAIIIFQFVNKKNKINCFLKQKAILNQKIVLKLIKIKKNVSHAKERKNPKS